MKKPFRELTSKDKTITLRHVCKDKIALTYHYALKLKCGGFKKFDIRNVEKKTGVKVNDNLSKLKNAERLFFVTEYCADVGLLNIIDSLEY